MNNELDTTTDDKLKTSAKDGHLLSNNDNNFSQSEETVQKIPLFAENFDITKKTEETQVHLTKKWTATTKKIEIPVKYEELLINDKEFDHYNESEITEIFSKIKHKITDVFSHHDKDTEAEDKQKEQQLQQSKSQKEPEHQYHQPSDIEIKKYDEKQSTNEKENDDQNESSNKRIIPFSLDDKDASTKMQQEENIIPLWGEEITINKKMVKIGEIIIRKYQTNEKQKIDVDVKSEKLIVKYPDNRQEEIM